MPTNTLPTDSNSKPAEGVFDPTTGHVVAAKSGTVATTGGGTEYAPTIVNIADPTTPTSQLAVNSLGQVAVSNFPSTQSVIGTVSVAQFPSVQPVSGAVDTTDRASRQLGHVVVDLGGAGTNTAPGYMIIQDPTTNSRKMAVNADGSVNVSGTISATNPSVGTDGSAIPTSSTLVGASDGTNLQPLQVESASNRNLRAGIYSGANEATVTGANALKVDNSGITQPVSAAILPLPTGAATLAKQPALGTAGVASADVLSVQGIASMTALKTDGSGVTQPVSGTITATQATGSNLHAVLDSGSTTIATQATGTNLHMVVDSGTVTANAQQADLTTTGTISVAQPVVNTPVSNATVVLAVGQGQSTWKAQLLAGGGGFTSGTTIVADKSPDGGTTWYSASFKVSGAVANTPVSTVVGPGPLELTGNAAGISHVRVRCSVLNPTETIVVTLRSGVGIGDIGLLSPIPAGSNLIGGVNVVDSAGTNKQTVNSAGQAQVEDIEQSGYVALTSPPVNTNAASDTALTFSSQVNRVIMQNNYSATIYFDFDQVASTASFALLPGSLLIYPKKCTSPHVYTTVAVPLNAASGILLRGAN